VFEGIKGTDRSTHTVSAQGECSMSKKIHKLIPAVALALAATKASAQVLYEPFNYTVGTTPLETDAAAVNKNYSTSGTYWAQRGTTGGAFVVGTGLGSPNAAGILPPTMGGSGQYTNATGRTPDIGFGQTVSSGDLYYSLSFKIPAGGLSSTTAGNLAGFSNFAVPSNAAAGVFQAGLRLIPSTTTSYQLGMTGGGTTQTFTGATFAPGDTVLVVARYRIVPGGNNDQVAMWINPTTGFGDNSAIPATSLAWTHTASDATHDSQATSTPMLAGFFLRSYSATNNLQVDELRVDSTWAGVTPNGNLQYTWTDAGGGANTFANANKWTKLGGAPVPAPNGVGHVANFGSGIASGSSVTSAGEVIDSINFTNTGSITVDGTGLSIGSNASAGSIVAYAGNHTINAPLVMASNLSLKTSPGTSITLGPSATIGGVGKTLGMYGTGTVNLSASNMIDDAARLEVRSGTLNMNGNSETVDVFQLGTGALNPGTALPAPYNGDLAVGTLSNGTITANSYDLQSGTISATVAGANGVVKNLAGFVTLSGNNTYTGNTVVNAGQLTLSGTNSNPVNAVINLQPQISGSINNLAITSNAALGASGASVTWTPDVNVASGTLLLTEDMTLAPDRVLNINHSASRIGASAGKTGVIQPVLSGTGGVGINGAGTIVLDATNTYSGNTSLIAGTLQVSSQGNLGNGSGTNNLVFNNGILKTGASLGTVNKTVALLAGGNGTVDTNGFDTTFAGVVSGTAAGTIAAGAFTKAGAGTLVLTASNTYDGITNVNGGALRVTNAAALGSSAGTANRTVIDGGGGLTNLAVLEVDGTAGGFTVADEVRIGGKTSTGGGNSSASLRNVAGNNTVSNVVLAAGGTWYNIESAAGNLTISGVNNALTGSTRQLFLKGAGDGEITGALTATSAVDSYVVTKQGAGTWTLSGANTYNWVNNVNVSQTTVEGGILRTTGVGTLGAAGGPVLNNATIQSYSNNTLGTVNGTGTLVVGDGTTGVNVSATHFRQGAVSVANGSTASVVADVTGNGTSKIGTLSVTGTGKFDMKRNKVITDTPVGSGVAGGGNYTAGSVSRLVQSASNGGAWDGPGLTTSEGDATAGLTSIGVALASAVRDFGVGTTLLFAGQTITPSSTLAMYTYAGDANLDGQITGDDYSGIDFTILDSGNTGGWFNGDFNYDGFVSGDDYSAIDFNILAQGAAFPTGGAASLSGVTAVPEPATLSVLGLGAAAAMGRRRRRAN
jgi:autotransporter-associated beta strand protein